MARKGEIVAGLDVGTTKTSAFVAEIKEEGKIELLGYGSQPSKGMQAGMITDINSTVDSIRAAVAEAGNMAGVEITRVYAGIAGQHIRGFNSHGITKVENKEITQADMDRVVDQANAVAIPVNQRVLHTIVQEYIVDGQDGIKYPSGMRAIRLEAKVHIVTGSVTAAENILRCCTKSGLQVADLILEPLASSLAVLTDDERELGVAMVDIGGGTSDLIIFHKGNVVHTAVLGIGGDLITHDIAVGMGTPMAAAEKLKRTYGTAMACLVDKAEMLDVPKVGSGELKPMSRQVLSDIIEARIEEIVTMIHKEIRKTSLEELLGAGVVITGGVANLPGVAQLAEELMDMPVRCALPTGISKLSDLVRNPSCSTGVGLLHYATRYQPQSSTGAPIFRRLVDRMKGWLEDFI